MVDLANLQVCKMAGELNRAVTAIPKTIKIDMICYDQHHEGAGFKKCQPISV